jgi:thiol-disulfide isomerase/thioredoxin
VHFLRRNARFNTPGNPVSWTLAGLHMPVGTDVMDDRISRSIGWWNGSRISENPPPGTPQTKPKNPPNLGKLLELVAKDPKSAFAAHACFTVATLLKRDANEGSDERATTEAERLFERIVTDFGEMEWDGMKLGDRVKPELSELRRLGIGKVAPEIEADDLEGRRMKLSDYRGKVVVLSFWGSWCGPCMQMVPEERKLVERMAGKSFALIGINSDNDRTKVKAAIEKEKITWRSFRDGAAPGPIATAWNIRSWPTIYVLDVQGVIRYRNVRGQALIDAVDALVPERK